MTEIETKIKENPDSFDYADIPDERNLSQVDRDASTPDHIKKLIAERAGAKGASAVAPLTL